MSTTAEEGDVENFVLPGTEGTNWMEVEDRSGDAYYDEKEEMPVGVLVLIIFVVGASVAVMLFAAMYVVRNRKERQKELAADGGSGGGSSRNGSALASGGGGSRNFTTQQSSASSPAVSTDPEKRKQEIEANLVVKIWMKDILPEPVDVGAAGDDVESGNNKNSCPVCRKPYEEGDEVVHLSCEHGFHKSCILNWLQYQERCPVCNVGSWEKK